jgi:hypothetical protein
VKAVVFHEFGGVDLLQSEVADDPQPAPGECWSTSKIAMSSRGAPRLTAVVQKIFSLAEAREAKVTMKRLEQFEKIVPVSVTRGDGYGGRR